MAEGDFLLPQAQDEARRVIAAIERETSAEVVVTVRRVSGRYREADYLAGFILSLAALVALLFVPRDVRTVELSPRRGPGLCPRCVGVVEDGSGATVARRRAA